MADRAPDERLRVTVAYVGAGGEFLRSLEVAPGTTLGLAIKDSGLLERCPEVDLKVYRVGVWGRIMGLGQVLADGDRVEVYRPLAADPKEARRQRAMAAKSAGTAAGG